jgi:toxin ParE1/3/4
VPEPRVYTSFRWDIQDVLAWSADRFGVQAADRYAELIRVSFKDLIADPVRPGTKKRPELSPVAYTYHLKFSREHIPAERRVKAPRHFILYRYNQSRIEFARLLHDSCDLSRVILL